MREQRDLRWIIRRGLPGTYIAVRDGILGRIKPENLQPIQPPLSSEEEDIVSIEIKNRISSSQYQDVDLNPNNVNFEFVIPNPIQLEFSPDSLYCLQCKRVFSASELFSRKKRFHQRVFQCPICSKKDKKSRNFPLYQIPFVFTHSRCGAVEDPKPSIRVRCGNCSGEMILELYRENLNASYYICPSCKAAGKDPDVWRKRFVTRWCNSCYQELDESEESTRHALMRVRPATSAVYPQNFVAVVTSGDYHTALAQFLRIEPPQDFVIPPELLPYHQTNPELVRTLLQDEKEKYISDFEKRVGSEVTLHQDARHQLKQYNGFISNANIRYLEGEFPPEAQIIQQNFGLKIRYIDNLKVIEGSYGYIVGTSQRARARLRYVPGSNGIRTPIVVVRPFETEALLVEFEASQIREFLGQRGFPYKEDQDLFKALFSVDDTSEVLKLCIRITHTVSHMLIRTAELFTGVSRETISEIQLPRVLSFILYNSSGSTLGSICTTFESQMYNWLVSALNAARKCPYDPLCFNDDAGAACVMCSHIPERNCTQFWNQQLDRRTLLEFWPPIDHRDEEHIILARAFTKLYEMEKEEGTQHASAESDN